MAALTDHADPAVSLLLAFTRLEAKVDVALAQQGGSLTTLDAARLDHEGRLRVVEAAPVPPDLDERLRVVEARPSVSPRALWAAVVSAIGVVATALTIINHFNP